MRRILLILNAVSFMLMALIPGRALALGLGEIKVNTTANQRFLATIPAFVDETENNLTAAIGTNSDYALMQIERPEFVETLGVSVMRDPQFPDRMLIVISSTEAVYQPSFNLVVKASAGGGTILENYFLTLDFRKSLSLELPDGENMEIKSEPDAGKTLIAEETKADMLKTPPVTNGAEATEKAPIPVPSAQETEAIQKLEAEQEPVISVAPSIIETSDATSPPLAQPEETAPETAEEEKPSLPAQDMSLFPTVINVSEDPAKNRISVTRGDNLFGIAKKLGADRTALAKVVASLYLENRSAFINDNINKLRADVELTYNEVNAMVSRISTETARDILANHWKEQSLTVTPGAISEKSIVKLDIPLKEDISMLDVVTFLENWKKYWMGKDDIAMASAYSDDFMDQMKRGKREFLEARKHFNSTKTSISIIMENINIVRGGQSITAYFNQIFKSSTFSSIGTKRIELKNTAVGLKIVDEEFIPHKISDGRYQWVIHLASYRGKATVVAHINNLRKAGFSAFEASSFQVTEDPYKLLVGRFVGKEQAIRMASKLKKLGQAYTKVLKLPVALEVDIFSSMDEAENMLKKLVDGGYSPHMIETISDDGMARYGVYLGAFPSEAKANEAIAGIKDLDVKITMP